MRGTTEGGGSYGIGINFADPKPREFSDWAWGGDDAGSVDEASSTANVGWLSFNCSNEASCGSSNYMVLTTFSAPPIANELSVDEGSYCYSDDTPPGRPLFPTFYWTFVDPEPSDSQGFYQVQVATDFNFSSLVKDSGKVSTAGIPGNPQSFSYAVPTALPAYDTTYYWRVRVWDNWNTTSTGWNNTSWFYPPSASGTPPTAPALATSFTTPLHAYPDPGFTWYPSTPAAGEFVQFCSVQEGGVCALNVSTCYDINNLSTPCNGSNPSTVFQWSFPAGTSFATGSSATSSNPRVKFASSGDKVVWLNITDNSIPPAGSASCTTTDTVGIYVPLPTWKEISP